MAAPTGNQFWRNRTRHGNKQIFTDPEVLMKSCEEYFDWVDENPLKEAIVCQGMLNEEQSKPLMRAMTIGGLCLYLGITLKTLQNYKSDENLIDVIEWAELIIREQKFTGAAAGLLHANIIARDLGLRDANSVEHTGAIEHTHTVEFVGVGKE